MYEFSYNYRMISCVLYIHDVYCNVHMRVWLSYDVRLLLLCCSYNFHKVCLHDVRVMFHMVYILFGICLYDFRIIFM